MRIAVVRNRDNQGVISRFGQPSPERYGRRSIQAVLDALRAGGHTARVLEADMNLLAELKDFIPVDAESGRPTGFAFNMSYGMQGEARYAHAPLMLEMGGVPYTGSGPRAHAVCLDKVLTKLLIRHAGIPTPNFCTIGQLVDLQRADGFGFPLVVKPRYESTSYGLALVHDPEELRTAVERVITGFEQDALVEEYIDGREVAVAILGNDPPEILPLVEIDFGSRAVRMMTGPDKFHKTEDEPQKVCPAPLAADLAEKVRQIGLDVFRVCECRDYARIDIRLDRNDEPYVLEINSMASLGQGGAYVLAAQAAGYSFEQLILRIADVAHQRAFGIAAPRGPEAAALPILPAAGETAVAAADHTPSVLFTAPGNDCPARHT